MIAPLIIITAVLLIIFNFYAYSSIIFISSIHIGYCLIDLYLVGTAWVIASNIFKIQMTVSICIIIDLTILITSVNNIVSQYNLYSVRITCFNFYSTV